MKSYLRFLAPLVVAILLSAVTAKADGILNYQITGAGLNASFSLPSNPTVTLVNPGNWFTLNPVPGILNGSPVNFNIGFYNSLSQYVGGLALYVSTADYAPAFGSPSDPQLYIGPENGPTMLPGTYQLFSASGTPYTLAVSTPEPSSLLLLGIGGAALLGFLRKQLA